ncbi:hypothetical protein HYH03_006389 [Edaphochlamys debaryana]|uniref:Chalcone isomerase domain-containing protein n=1 Tax=Edaphochlamys debaryana TaxID=47281 RepID=A0A835Y658_9CHLO|nr:hypothetical protein HYH03_006389 [Edaphochlamys debaryana]|eukprot:KAG2495443.1 hypothetical protein HYH03_006389 [Edaphochlamys debaryana]
MQSHVLHHDAGTHFPLVLHAPIHSHFHHSSHRSPSTSHGADELEESSSSHSHDLPYHHHNSHAHSHSGVHSHSLQQLLAVGSRQWGSGSWWDSRSLLRVKIYDFAIYADATKARSAVRSQLSGGRAWALAAAAASDDGASVPAGPAQALVSPSSGVAASLTIRACRNLPLPLLSGEFERILQRRHRKAGGREDDPALAELLSYFTRERLPAHVVVPAPPGAAPGPNGAPADAVKKGAAITFSRSPSGELVTEAGGRVLGRLHSPPLAEALFDLYLGDQPVSRKAKAAAGAALLQLAADEGEAPRHPYRLQTGERLLCGPGGGAHNPSACVLQMP